MDRNWFFSSLAQSAAAIVGLLGAVLVSRLLQQLTSATQSRAELVRDFLTVREKLSTLLETLNGHAELRNQAIDAVRRNFENAKGRQLVIDYSGPHMYNPYAQQQRNVHVNEQTIPRLSRELKQILDAQVLFAKILNSRTLTNIDAWTADFQRFLPTLPDDIKQDAHSQLTEMRSIARHYKGHQAGRISWSSIIAALAMIELLAFAVVWPLTELYAGNNEELKIWMLTVFMLGLLALLAYFIVLFRDLHRNVAISVPIEEKSSTER